MEKLLLIAMGVLVAAACPAATHYVVTNGTPGHIVSADPYTNWATAGTNIIDVVNCAMTNAEPRQDWVSNGTYYLTNQVVVTNALTIQSVNGRNATVVDGYNYPGKPVTNRCFYRNAAGATLDGFTVTNGRIIGGGGGVYLCFASTAKNCRVTGCLATNVVGSYSYGGGVWSDGAIEDSEIIGNVNHNNIGGGIFLGTKGKISNCVVANNLVVNGYSTDDYSALGAGIFAANGIITDCRIYGNNTSTNTDSGGGGIFIQNGNGLILRNSLIYSNFAYGAGGGVYVDRSKVEILNCTIAGNTSIGRGGGIGVLISAGKTVAVENVISYLNFCENGNSNIYIYDLAPYTGTVRIINSCIAPTNAFSSNMDCYYYAGNIESNPQFVDKDTGNWRLSKDSPCVNTGSNQNWMTNAVDLDGRQRIRYGTVDMGAYETIYEGTIYRFGF
jgi:hypothetical protein